MHDNTGLEPLRAGPVYWLLINDLNASSACPLAVLLSLYYWLSELCAAV